ncbi:hypothetical protein D9757_003290 [Collybiopsis confluens]|uniref:DUF7357 domain-containing protein n=1 Tax=Collybiopsis confluens TaxID=2823264 RepID=A0A8H5MFM4_9AGAR|nr:hypothetical protein D9757_003290 [Collybiopsis confluens]
MRIRLQTSSTELPELKAWFALSASSESHTIDKLKKSICNTIKSFKNADISFHDFQLELDGFELLDELLAAQVLREGDLVVLKGREIYTGLGKKRKAADEGTGIAGKKLKKAQSPLSTSESSSEPSSSSSESDSNSSSSDSDSYSDSSSSQKPPVDSAKLTRPLKTADSQSKTKPSAEQSHVPPGLGSTSTRKRNFRRRLKKKYDAAAQGQGPPPSEKPLLPKPKRISEANVASLGTRIGGGGTNTARLQEHEVDTVNDPLNLSMFSLGNKNKKKGFKYALVPPSSQKKVFNAPELAVELIPTESLDGPLPPSTTIFTSASTEEDRRHQQARLIPPSELQSLGKLPRNMFVTSVDVEEGMWDKSSKKQQKKRKEPLQQEELNGDQSLELYDAEEIFDLDYGTAEGFDTAGATTSEDLRHDSGIDSKSALVWSVVEQTFDTYPLVTSGSSLENGKMVAWKALALNPETFSPEILLHIATVSHSESNEETSVRRLIRPGWEELDVENVEGLYRLESMIDMGWRVVNEIKRS